MINKILSFFGYMLIKLPLTIQVRSNDRHITDIIKNQIRDNDDDGLN